MAKFQKISKKVFLDNTDKPSRGSYGLSVFPKAYTFSQPEDGINIINVNYPNLPVFATQAAAIAGGLTAGRIYTTSTGTLRIVV